MSPPLPILSGDHLTVIEPLESRIAPSTIVVTTLADTSGKAKLSLRDAITMVNNDSTDGIASPDVIVFRPTPTSKTALKGTITLTSDLPGIANDINIIGAGITISGAGKFEGLSITGGAVVSVSGLRIMNGKATTGGGISVTGGGTVGFTKVTVQNSKAVTGGGVYIYDLGNKVNFSGCTISGNHAVGVNGSASMGYDGLGGGLANKGGTVLIAGSKITGNTAAGGAGDVGYYNGGNAHGGGIMNAGMLTLQGSTVSGNTAKGGAGGAGINYSPGIGIATSGGNGGLADGAGVANMGGTLVIQKGSVISKNTATGGAGGAGGKASIGVNGGNFTVSGGTPSGPYDGTSGGNGYNGGSGGNATGGGVSNSGTGAITITLSTVSGNTATAGAGGNGAAGGKGGNGGRGGAFQGTTYNAGNGGYGGNGGNGGNGGEGLGGGIYSAYSLTVGSSTISGNMVKSGKAGALGAAGKGGTGYMPGSDGSAGTAGAYSGSRGGGISSDDPGNTGLVTMSLSQVTLAGNSAVTGGGLSIYQNGQDTIHNCTISLNKATTGGGVSVVPDASNDSINFVSTIIAANTATTNPDIDGVINSTHDLIQIKGTATISGGTGDIYGQSAQLGSLGVHDLPKNIYKLETLLPSKTSPAVVNSPGSNPDGLAVDENGELFTANIDIGAVQRST